MTLAQEYALGNPVAGNRSVEYIGVNLFLALEFFNETSTDDGWKRRPYTCHKFCNRSEHRRLKAELAESSKALGLSVGQLNAEWKALVKCGTEKCTEHFQSKAPHKLTEPVRFNAVNIEALKHATALSLRWLCIEVGSRARLDYWETETTKKFPDGKHIYVIHLNGNRYKIGVHNQKGDSHKRLIASQVFCPDAKIILKIWPCDVITESSIHRLFAKHRCSASEYKSKEPEVFELSNEQLDLLQNKTSLRKAILCNL